MTATLFDTPELRETALNVAEAAIRRSYNEADLLALSPREMKMLTHTAVLTMLEGFSMAILDIASGRLTVEMGRMERNHE